MTNQTIRSKVLLPAGLAIACGIGSIISLGALFQLPTIDLMELAPYQRLMYILSPVGGPFLAYYFLVSAYDAIRPRHLTVTRWGLRTRTWALHWSEITNIRVQRGPRIALDVTRDAYARERWWNKRDAARLGGIASGLLPPRKNTIHCSEHLKTSGQDLVDLLDSHRHSFMRMEVPPDEHKNPQNPPTSDPQTFIN